MRLTKAARLLAAGVLLLGGTLACSGEGEEPENVLPEPRDRLEYASTDIPNDRAADAVSSALGRLDPCALVDPRGGNVPGYPASSEVEARSPHSCEVTNPEGEKVTMTFGVELATSDRFTNQLTSFGGAKAYVLAGPSKHTFCRVALPVSFTHSIEVRASSGGVDSHACADAKGFAALAATRLENPDGFELPAGPTRWTACDVLRSAVELTPKTELRSGWDLTTGLDQCGVWDKSGGSLGGIELQPVMPHTYLTIEYDDPSPDFPRDLGTVRGRRLNGYHSGACVIEWTERRPPAAIAKGEVARFQVSATSCRKAKRLVADIAKVIDSDRVARPADPQRPVLYAPDEPDIPAAGACVDVANFEQADCEPYADAEAPTNGQETIDEATADPNVNCAIAVEAVQEHIGSTLQPVTALNGTDATGKPRYMCGFVEPTHALQVWIAASKDPMNQEAGSEVAGHPANDVTTKSDGIRQLWVALDGSEQPGHLYAEVRVLPSRSTGMYSDSPVDTLPLADLDEAMSDIVAAHFVD